MARFPLNRQHLAVRTDQPWAFDGIPGSISLDPYGSRAVADHQRRVDRLRGA